MIATRPALAVMMVERNGAGSVTRITVVELGQCRNACSRLGSWGAPGVQRPADGGTRCRVLAERGTTDLDRLTWSKPLSAGYKLAPPVGFEPTLTAPEAVALSPELWGPGERRRLTPPSERTPQHYQDAADSGHAAEQRALSCSERLLSRG